MGCEPPLVRGAPASVAASITDLTTRLGLAASANAWQIIGTWAGAATTLPDCDGTAACYGPVLVETELAGPPEAPPSRVPAPGSGWRAALAALTGAALAGAALYALRPRASRHDLALAENPLTPRGQAIAIGLGVLGAGGLLALVLGRASAAPAPGGGSSAGGAGGGSGPSGAVWTRNPHTIYPRDRVRISMATSGLAKLPGFPNTLGGFRDLLMSPEVQQLIAIPGAQFWSPGDLLPADWPADDADPAHEYHADFRYAGPAVSGGALAFPGAVIWTSPT